MTRVHARAPAREAAPAQAVLDTAVLDTVQRVASALGLDIAHLDVHVDDGLTIRGASGLSQGNRLWFDERMDARSLAGREVVAHEVVHAAQRTERGRHPGARRPDPAAAEREAHRLARRFVEGRPLPRPRATLATDHLAADVDWAGLDQLRDDLDAYVEVVQQANPHEWQTLQDAVGADGSVPDDQVDLIVRTLAPFSLPVARALLRGLDPEPRFHIVDQLNATHYEQQRPVVIAALAALNHSDAARLRVSHLQRLDLSGLTPLEHDLLLLAMADVDRAVTTELLAGESGERPWRQLMTGAAITTTSVMLLEGLAAEQARAAAVHDTATREQASRLATELSTLIDHNDSSSALTRLAALDDDLRRAVVAALETSGHVARLIERLDDHDEQGGPLASSGFGALLAARSVATNLATITDRLSGGIFGWDWTEDIAITQADALVAFWAIAALPLDVRERLLRARDTGTVNETDQGDLLDKMERNLPEWFVEGTAYRSLAVGRDRNGSLFERGTRMRDAWARQGTAGFLIEVRRMIADGRRTEALLALDSGTIQEDDRQPRAPGAPAAITQHIEMTDDVRAVLVDRLDALDVMDSFLENLPFEIRQGRDHRMQLLTVCSARSVPNLLRHIDDLLHVGVDDWAVMSWEADLAFVQYRSLPPYEQQRFTRLGEITGEMSADMRTWSGTNMLDVATSRRQLDTVLDQLSQDRFWTARHAGQLRVLVATAVALGARREVFEFSRLFHAHTDDALQSIVQTFRLYDPSMGRVRYEEETLENTPISSEGPFYYGTLIGGFMWVALRDAMSGTFGFDLFNGTISHREFDLGEMGSLLGGHAGGARFADRNDTERGRERNPDVSERANRAALDFDQRNNTLRVDIPELALEGLGLLRTGWSATFGAIRAQGLQLNATFDTGNLRHPRTVQLDASGVSLQDVLYTTPTTALGVGRIGMSGFHLHGAASTMGSSEATGRGAWTYIPVFGPLFEYLYLLVQTIGLGMHAAGQIAQGSSELSSVQVSLDGITIDGLLVGGVPIEQVRIGPVSLRWGGNRATYLEHLEAALRTRLGNEPQGPHRDELLFQLAAVVGELPRARADEQRLDTLMRRSYQDPSSMTPDDHAEIARLQGTAGGVTVDVGPIVLQGVGDIAERATIQRINGEVEGRMFSSGNITDRALADRFATSGPPTTVQSSIAAGGHVDFGDIDVVLTPPSSEQLQQWRAEAAAAGGTNRMARLDTAIELRAELDRLRALQNDRAHIGERPDSSDDARIDELLGLLATTLHATGVTAGVDTRTGVAQFGARRIHGGPVDTSGFGVGSFDVTGVNVPITSDPSAIAALMLASEQAEGMNDAGRRQLYGDRARDAITGVGLSVDRATLTDVRVGAGDSTIAEIAVNGLNGGAVTPVDEGVRITGMHVDSIVGQNARLRMGNHSVDAPGGISVEGIDASFTILLDADYHVTGAQVDTATIAAVRLLQPAPAAPPTAPALESAAPLSYTNLGSGIRVELFDGALRDIRFEQLAIDTAGVVRSTAPNEPGRDRRMASVGRIDGLRLVANAAGFQVGATLNSPETEAGSPGVIEVGEAGAGGTFVDLHHLGLTEGDVAGTGGAVRVRHLDWAGSRVRFDGDGIYLDSLDIPEIALGALHWRIGTTGEVSSVGGATLRGISAHARARLTRSEGETHVAEFVLPELRVDEISAEDIRYSDPPIDVRLRRLGPTDPAPVSIHDVVVSDVRWRPGETTTFDARTGTVGLAVDAGVGRPGAALADREMGFLGQIYAGSIHVAQDENGVIEGGVEHLGVVGDAHMAGVGDAHVNLYDLSLPGLTFAGNMISVPATAAGMLRLGSLELSAMSFGSSGGPTISTVGGSNLRIEDLGAGFDIHLVDVIGPARPGSRGGAVPTRKRLDRIVLHQLDVGQLSTTGLRIDLPGTLSATISNGPRRSAISGIHVNELDLQLGPRGTNGYRVSGWTYDEVRVDLVELHDLAVTAPIGVTLGEDIPEPTRRAQAIAAYAQESAAIASGVATTSDWIAAFSELIDTADGHVNFDLDLPIYVKGVNLGGHIGAHVGITNGEVNFVELESQALEDLNLADSVIDFEVKDHRLVIEFDLSQMGPIIGAGVGAGVVGGATRNPWGALGGAVVGGIGGGVAAWKYDTDIVQWDLSSGNELARADDDSMVRISRLTRPIRTPPSPDAPPIELDLGAMTVNDLDVQLSLLNDAPLTVHMPSNLGSIDFATGALRGLSIGLGGGLPGRPVRSPRTCSEEPPAHATMAFGLDSLRIAGATLNLPIGHLTTGAMRLDDLSGHIGIERLAMPETPATADRPHDSALGIRLVDVSGVAGGITLHDLVLTPGVTGGP